MQRSAFEVESPDSNFQVEGKGSCRARQGGTESETAIKESRRGVEGVRVGGSESG